MQNTTPAPETFMAIEGLSCALYLTLVNTIKKMQLQLEYY